MGHQRFYAQAGEELEVSGIGKGSRQTKLVSKATSSKAERPGIEGEGIER